MKQPVLSDIKNILILGAGTLGSRIGLQAAISDFRVTIYDPYPEVFSAAQALHQKLLGHLQKAGTLTAEEGKAIVERISWSTDLARACQDQDLVSESVPEDLALKQKVWAEAGKYCPAHTLFTTNTSYLLPSAMAEATGRPDRFCAFHFHDVFYSRIVDVMPHPGTASWFPPLLIELGARLNQVPVLVRKESPGYIFNAMLMACLQSAGDLVISGVTTPEDVDRSWMVNFRQPIGPFGMMDAIGLETAWRVVNSRDDVPSQRFAGFLKGYIDAGKLGVKSGEGFYTYPHPAFKAVDFV